MSQLPEVPQSAYKGLTLFLRGSAIKNGNQFRTLSTLNDELTFVIYDSRNNILLTKKSGTGIEQTDDGKYLITIPASEVNRQTFPLDQYRYAVRIIEGDTGDRHLVQHGPFYFKTIPF